MKSFGGGTLKGLENTKWGNIWGWIKRQIRETHPPITLVVQKC